MAIVDPNVGVTARQAAEATGASYRQIDYWARTNLLTPSIVDARGSGSRRRYSTSDINLGRILVALSNNGSLDVARRHINDLRHLLEAPPATGGVYVTPSGIHTSPPPDAAVWIPLPRAEAA